MQRFRTVLLSTLVILALLVPLVYHRYDPRVADVQAAGDSGPYEMTFDGSTPGRGVEPGWDLTISSDSLDSYTTDFSPYPMPNCEGGQQFHTPNPYEYDAYLCSNHMMTKINEGGYGFLTVTPNQLVDFSAGEAVIRWDQSTVKTSGRDWLEFWITPTPYHLLLGSERWGNSKPRYGVQFKMDSFPGGTAFRTLLYRNFTSGFAGDEIGGSNPQPWNTVLTPSDTRLDTLEVHISRTHIKFGMPAYNLWWVDQDIADLGWSTGVFQITQSTYRPELPCNYDGSCGPAAWHYKNLRIDHAIPFTIIRGDSKLVSSSTSQRVNFSQPAPAGSDLRFTGMAARVDVSFDNGNTWQRATLRPQPTNNAEGDEHPDDYTVSMPEGATSALFRAQRWWGGDYQLNNFAIYSFTSAGDNPTPTPSPTSTPDTVTASPTPDSGDSTDVNFDDLSNPNRPLNGVYPSGIIDWGQNAWYLSGPYGRFNTNSVSFRQGITNASFTVSGSRRMVQLDAYNGGTNSTTVTINCPGRPSVQANLSAGQLSTLSTGWANACSPVSISATNGWQTNFKHLRLVGGGQAATAAPTLTPTSTRTPTPMATRTPTPTPTPTPTTTGEPRIATFDDLSNPNRPLTGQYPSGLIDWGSNGWYLSGPFGQFSGNSASFNGSAINSATFSVLGGRRLVQMDVFNGGNTPSTVSVSCGGQMTQQSPLNANQRATLQLNWTASCSPITLSTSNGWNTNFKNLVFQ